MRTARLALFLSWLWPGLLTDAAAATPASDAAQSTCIQLKTTTEVRRVDADAQGRELVRLEPVKQIAAGDEVIYTIAAANVCKQPVPQSTITYAVPEHMAFVPNSAIAPAADISFSVDGGFHFTAPEALYVQIAGELRIAKPEEYTHIRWILRRPLAPQAVALARFRAVVK
jgi:uncharacterized repeat protein (TIGR01451 family)